MWGSDWELCARIVTPGVFRYVVKQPIVPGWYPIYEVTAPGQLPTLFDAKEIPAEFPHFPYGEAVIPD